jgi:nitrite reductase/ring-hydroxylating ferredoxin subunit
MFTWEAAGQVQMGLVYQLGVDVNQLPQLIEEVVQEYYLRRRPGQTFSAYWRERLKDREATKAADHDYSPPVWLCESCGFEHRGEDPPVFCPSCAGLRRNFARLEAEKAGALPDRNNGATAGKLPQATTAAPLKDPAAANSDGFVAVATLDSLPEQDGLAVTVAGREVALFRHRGGVAALDNACPHEGGPLAQGTRDGDTVVCPWHAWAFDLCTGCSVAPTGEAAVRHEVRLEDGKVLVRLAQPVPPA